MDQFLIIINNQCILKPLHPKFKVVEILENLIIVIAIILMGLKDLILEI